MQSSGQCWLSVLLVLSRLDSGNPFPASPAGRSKPPLQLQLVPDTLVSINSWCPMGRKRRKNRGNIATQSLSFNFLWHIVCLKLHLSCCCWHSLPHTSVMRIHWQMLETAFGKWNASSVKHYYFSCLMAVYRFVSPECLPNYYSLLASASSEALPDRCAHHRQSFALCFF